MLKQTRRWSLLWLAAVAFSGTLACEPPARTAEPGSYALSSRLGISADGQTLYVALPDHDLVRAVDAASGEVKGEVAVTGTPHRLTVLSDGRVAVSAQLAGAVSILSPDASAVLSTVEVGSDPHGLIEADGYLVVAVSGQNELARIPLDDATRVSDRVSLEHGAPRGLALAPDGTLFVSHFHGGVLSTVDLGRGVPSGTVAMNLPSNPFFVPNQLESLTVSPDGAEIAVPHQECNNDPAQFGAGGTDFTGSSSVQYYVEGPTGYPAVVPAVSRVDTSLQVNVSDGPGPLDPSNPSPDEAAGLAPTIINPLDTNLLGNDLVNGPVAVALADGGRVELLVNRNSGNVLVRRARLGENQRSILAMVDVGVGASSIVLSPDGDTAYVWNDFTHELSAFAVPVLEDAVSPGGGFSVSRHETDEAWAPFGGAQLPRIERARVAKVADDVLPEAVVRGRKLFHSVDDRLTRRGAISCASCHPGGAPDSITWRFAEGPRQTPPLWGGIMDTAPFHWDQAVTSVETLNVVTVQGRMAGTGLSEADLRDVGAFIDTIPAPSPPLDADQASVERGAEIFFSDEADCVSCHSGTDFTDGLAHNVGTGSRFVVGETADSFATPVLHGLAHSAPYMHDGSARTLEDLVERFVRTDKMGRGSHLSDQDLRDLVAFLKAL